MTVFLGGGQPLTWTAFSKSVFSVNSGTVNGVDQNAPGVDAGDRRAGFDFSYRIPYLRNWLTLYSDSLSDDDPSPLAAPRRAAINPGLYLARVPGLEKLDLRVEAVNTDPPTGRSIGGQFIYWNVVYRDSHTNKGFPLGSWIGREGRGLQVFTTYWFSPQNTITLSYRNGRVSKDFVPNGGNLNDFSARANWLLRSDLTLSSTIQYERWSFPLLASAPQSNVTASFQLSYRPLWRKHR